MNANRIVFVSGAFAAALALAACTPLADRAEGEPCSCTEQCLEGLYCTVDEEVSLDGTCGGADGECRSFRHAGESCTRGSRPPLRCAAHLVCRPFEEVCGPPLAQGDRCDESSADCADGLTCNRGLAPAQCSAPRAEGEPCTLDVDCAAQLACNDGYEPGRCEAHGASSEGEPCSADLDCATGLVCNDAMAQPVCVVPFDGAKDTECNDDVQCASHHCVTWSEGTQGYWIGRCS